MVSHACDCFSPFGARWRIAVPRYFFNLHDGHDFIDNVGSEHPDLHSARAEAVENLGERMRGTLLIDRDVSACVINVTDEAGVTVLIVSLCAAAQIIPPVRSAIGELEL
ncbi:hypothetical protein SB748_28380 [Rhizobium sp. SIMBA_035]